MKTAFARPLFYLFLLFPGVVLAQQSIKVMAYNLLNYEGITADTATRNPYLRTIMSSVKPDLLLCGEVVSEFGITGFVANVMNDSAEEYTLGDYIPGFDTNNALVYRTDAFEFVSNIPIHTDLRDINEFTVVHTLSGDTLRMYALHLKASSSPIDEAKRLAEVQELREHTNALPDNSDFFVCGDFNIYSSNEPAYELLLQDDPDNDGHVNDPFTLSGTWNNPSYSIYHTQSTRTQNFGGGATGGLDDRFDMILFSNALMQSGHVTYISESTIAYGNDGNHYNKAINQQPNTAVSPTIADALHFASDHLPVIAELNFEDTGSNEIDGRDYFITAYPNPFDDQLHITFSPLPQGQIHLRLTNIFGRIVDEEFFSPAPLITRQTRALKDGIYFYSAEVNGKRVMGTVVKGPSVLN